MKRKNSFLFWIGCCICKLSACRGLYYGYILVVRVRLCADYIYQLFICFSILANGLYSEEVGDWLGSLSGVSLLFLSNFLPAALASHVVFLGANFVEDRQATLVWHRDVECVYIGVGNLVNSVFHDLCVFCQQVLVGSSLFREVWEICWNVAELAANSIYADRRCSHIWVAQGHLELARNVRLLDKLLLTMSESAIVSILAAGSLEVELAKFSLFFKFVRRLLMQCKLGSHPRQVKIHLLGWHKLSDLEHGLHGDWCKEALSLLLG